MSILITHPESEQEFQIGTEINFKGTADAPITQVEIWIDDRWLIQTVPVNEGQWSFSYSFLVGGSFIVYAKGLDENKTLIDVHNIWVFTELLPEEIVSSASIMSIVTAAAARDLQLTTNFFLSEFTISTTARRLGIDNTSTQTEIDRLRQLCQQILQPARDALGSLDINSGFRSEALNRAVGGTRNSAHRLGYAADVIPNSGDTRSLAKWVVDNSTFDQVILEFGTLAKPDWIHISSDPRNRGDVLRATRDRNGQTIYTPITI